MVTSWYTIVSCVGLFSSPIPCSCCKQLVNKIVNCHFVLLSSSPSQQTVFIFIGLVLFVAGLEEAPGFWRLAGCLVGCKSYRGCHDMSLMSHKGVQQQAPPPCRRAAGQRNRKSRGKGGSPRGPAATRWEMKIGFPKCFSISTSSSAIYEPEEVLYFDYRLVDNDL